MMPSWTEPGPPEQSETGIENGRLRVAEPTMQPRSPGRRGEGHIDEEATYRHLSLGAAAVVSVRARGNLPVLMHPRLEVS